VLITSPEHPPVHRQGCGGQAVFTFRQGCSYRMRLEAWYAHAHTPMGRVMEIESYQSMLACVIAGAGVAMMAQSMLDSLPGATGCVPTAAGAVRPGGHLADVAPGYARG
jgi:DNA-binding transcriptional LysR family regulator